MAKEFFFVPSINNRSSPTNYKILSSCFFRECRMTSFFSGNKSKLALTQSLSAGLLIIAFIVFWGQTVTQTFYSSSKRSSNKACNATATAANMSDVGSLLKPPWMTARVIDALRNSNVCQPEQTKRIVIEGYLNWMCGPGGHLIATEAALAVQSPSIVGKELWTQCSQLEVLRQSLPPRHDLPLTGCAPSTSAFDLTTTESYDALPRFFVASNPNRPELMERQAQRLRHAGVADFEFIDFGNYETVRQRMDWILKHVYKDRSMFVPQHNFQNHYFATLTAFRFIELLATSNSTAMQDAVYVETDAVPIHAFRHKFASFYRQMKRAVPRADMAMLGSCLGLESGVAAVDYLSTNVAVRHDTRCFNAIYMTRQTAKRVLAMGAVGPALAIDHQFNQYMSRLKMFSVWANEPLFLEENKLETKLFC